MKTLFFIAILFATSTNLLASISDGFDTPDFSHFPMHVCEYLTDNYHIAKKIEHLYGIPASVTLGVSSFESGYGRSNYARTKNNHFGVKLRSGEFRTYGSKEASFYDFAELMISKLYRKILEHDKPQSLWRWSLWLQKQGYCRSKGYDEALYRVIRYINRKQQLNITNHFKTLNHYGTEKINRQNRKSWIPETQRRVALRIK